MLRISCDVVIVGAGPTGLIIANLLGLSGIHTVLIEKNHSTVQLPRAVSIDDEALRTIQSAGLIDKILTDVALDYGTHYYDAHGRCFARIEPTTREFGYPRRNAFEQPRLEHSLLLGLERFPNVSTLFDHKVESLFQTADLVAIHARNAQGQQVEIVCRYAVGADGAHSTLRHEIGAKLEGSTYDQRWLIIDLGATKEQLRQTRVICNPSRPAITLPGPRGIRRYEFLLHDNEADDRTTSIDFVRSLLAANGPDADAPIVRKQVYQFHARLVDRWSSGRVFLAGDAAHLSPPFAGQGMNSGIRDAHALAWRLVEVISGRMGRRLLDSYEVERAPHAKSLIQLAIRIGRVMMPTSRVDAAIVQMGLRAAAFVPPLHSYFVQMKYKPKPFYHTGFLASGDRNRHVGRMCPQPLLEGCDGTLRRFDDLVGDKFAIVVYGVRAQKTLRKLEAHGMPLPHATRLAILPMHSNSDRTSNVPGWRDVENRLSSFLAPSKSRLFIVRPDRYVFASLEADDIEDFDRMNNEISELIASTFR